MESAQYLECERQQIHVMNEKGKAITQITLDDDTIWRNISRIS